MDFKDIGYISKGVLERGKFRAQADGLAFKCTATGRVVQVKHSEIDVTEWLRVARGYEVKVMSREGDVYKFNGFKESDYADLKDFFKQHFGKNLKEVELCVKGWNWGEPVFKGSLLSFLVDGKPAFEIPLSEVSRVTSGKHEVALEFHQSDSIPVSLVEMRFHIPSTGVDGEDDPVQSFHDRVLAKADVLQATGDAIASFSEMQCLTPRGRYTIQIYPTFIGAHGKTFDYKIPFSSVTRFFLLPHNDQRQMFFVFGLDPPIRQGQTRYPFFILQMMSDETCELTLAMSEEEISEKYRDKLKQDMNGPLFEVFSRLMRVMVGKKITVPGSFKKRNNQCAISCSCKATSGFLYPLDKGFIFVHKPALFIKFEDIVTVNFERMASSGASRSFDFDIETKDGSVHHFSSLMKDDYGHLSAFVQEKKLRVKSHKKAHVSYNDELSGDSSDEHDAYLARVKAEGQEADDSEDDSDFVAKGSGSDDDLEYDSDAKVEEGSDSDGSGLQEEEEEEEEPERAKKRKKEQPKTQPAKKRKQEESSSSRAGKGKRAKKDPNAPKKPLSAYMLWLQEVRPSLNKKYPGSSVTEISKRAGELWREIGDKSKWEEQVEKNKVKYKRDMEEYKASGKASDPSPRKSPKKQHQPSKKKHQSPKKKQQQSVADISKFKSDEFIDSDDDSSSDDNRGKRSVKNETKKHKAKPSGQSSLRGRSAGKDEEMVSLGEEEEESESEAEMTDGEDDEEESD